MRLIQSFARRPHNRLRVIAALAALLAAGSSAMMSRITAQAPVGQGFTLNAADLRFILTQIKIAENHAAGNPLFGTGPNQVHDVRHPFGLRTVDGSYNNLIPGQEMFGAADRVFPRATAPHFRDGEAHTFDPDGPAGPVQAGDLSSYTQKKGIVNDSRPRVISNLIVDQTSTNPAALAAAPEGSEPDPASGTLFIPNVAPDVGLSAPFNSMFTIFGQFFDHGLDLVTKGGGTVYIPLKVDDPLYNPNSNTNFMVLTRATNRDCDPSVPGCVPDGVGDKPNTPQDESANDIQEGTNTTTPFVDQNQTYTSHPSHQVFLREYVLNTEGKPVATGKLIHGAIPGNIGNWAEVKAQAAAMLGIQLVDMDIFNVPLLATDPYGRFRRGPRGFAQLVMENGDLIEGDPLNPIPTTGAMKTGHAFLDDIAHTAVPKASGAYDHALLDAHFVTGDGRGNENIALTAVHTVFHGEHNRLADDINALINTSLTQAEIDDWNLANSASGWDYGERLFQAARFVTEMEYQHLVFEEFARKVQPQVNLFSAYHTQIDPAIVAEFAHTVYRFGHSMLTETVARINPDGTSNDMPLLDAFLNPLAFNNGGTFGQLSGAQGAGSVFQGMTNQVGNEIDEFITDALRNRLLGLPLDLATVNLSRGRSEGIPTLNNARRQFYAMTSNAALMPYESWADFQLGLRHPESVINFIAAYGTDPSITSAPTLSAKRQAAEYLSNAPGFMFAPASQTGVDDIDFWVGGLAEKQAPFGGLLGSTFNFIFETQLEKLQDGDRFYYLGRTVGMNLLVQLEGNSFAELVMRNTSAVGLPADAFSRADMVFNLDNLGDSGPILDDPTTPYNESALLIRMPDGTIRFNGPEHVVWNARDSAALDRIWSSEGDDTFRGNAGRDIMEGGAGNDQMIGGLGDDILTDAFGDDVIKGGDGHDAISSGQGFDLNQGGLGNDFIVAGSDITETFGGAGDDIIFAGDADDTVFGDDGDDWIEGGNNADLLQGDRGFPFQDDPDGGHDVIIGDGGNDDYDSEGGDDIMVSGPGIERNEGMLGFDWVTHRGDPQPANADMNLAGLLPPNLEDLRDRFDLTEGLSGWVFNDLLRGDDRLDVDMVGHELNAAGIARIAGLSGLLGGATSFTGGNIILGGGGSDTIEGRGGNDLIDGDAWLNVQLEAPGPNGPRRVDSLHALRAEVFAGTLNPGLIVIRRAIVVAPALPGEVDTAVFSGLLAEYTVTANEDGSVTVNHNGGIDGIDTLRNIEFLQFANARIAAPTPATLTVAFPNGGDRLFANVPTAIRWTVGSATSIDVAFSSNGGATYSPIPACTGLSGALSQCDWTPAAPATNNARVRVTAHRASGPPSVDTSNSNFAIATNTPALTVTAPNTALSWLVGSLQTIRWNQNLGINALVRIELSRDGGSTWQTLVASLKNTAAGTGQYSWIVTGPPTTLGVMRVTWVDGPVTDVSNTTFSIAQPTIGVTAPNTAVTWAVDTIRPITWSHNIPAGGRVNLDVSRDGGTSWTAIASSIVNTTASQGVFNWRVTGPVTGAARIRARWEADGATTDMSNVNFTIADPSVVVTTPNTNVSWRIASVQTVRATHNLGAGSTIVFELSRDGGGSWEPLANVATTTGTTTTYAWTVNGPITSQARVRAYWEARPEVGDVGDTNFTIQERITVTAPNTNVSWGVGTARVIAWTHNLGVGSAVNVELSRDGGASWETLAADLVHTSATSGSLAWTVTGPPTQTALIRVSSAADPATADVSNVTFRIP